MRIDLIKYQALGNDYLVLDLPGPLDDVVALLPVLCDRNRGLGSDGLLAFDPRAMTVRIFNPDRSEAQKSGNGLRIAAAHAVLEHGAGDSFSLLTLKFLEDILAINSGIPDIKQRPLALAKNIFSICTHAGQSALGAARVPVDAACHDNACRQTFYVPFQRSYSEDWIRTPFYGNEVASQLISAALFVGLCVYLWYGSLRHRED